MATKITACVLFLLCTLEAMVAMAVSNDAQPVHKKIMRRAKKHSATVELSADSEKVTESGALLKRLFQKMMSSVRGKSSVGGKSVEEETVAAVIRSAIQEIKKGGVASAKQSGSLVAALQHLKGHSNDDINEDPPTIGEHYWSTDAEEAKIAADEAKTAASRANYAAEEAKDAEQQAKIAAKEAKTAANTAKEAAKQAALKEASGKAAKMTVRCEGFAEDLMDTYKEEIRYEGKISGNCKDDNSGANQPDSDGSEHSINTDPITGAKTSSDCRACFPEDGNRAHLRSPCGLDVNTIALPAFSAQKNANCPFLGTLTNEGIIPDDWIINETVWRAAAFVSGRNGHDRLPDLKGHFAGNFRDHSLWIDRANLVKSVPNEDLEDAHDVECKFWYLNPVNMEGMGNEHKSSVGISDCPTDWAKCSFRCDSAGEWKCDGLNTPDETFEECQANLPNAHILDKFIQVLTSSNHTSDYSTPRTIEDGEDYVTTCMLANFTSAQELAHEVAAAGGNPNALVNDFHGFVPVESFGADCDHSFDDVNDDHLCMNTSGTGGHIGGSIVGGYIDLVHYFGEKGSAGEACSELDPKQPDGKRKYFKLKIKDLKRIDIERKMPCDFDRASFFDWMHKHNGVTDRRTEPDSAYYRADWRDSCNDAATEPEPESEANSEAESEANSEAKSESEAESEAESQAQ